MKQGGAENPPGKNRPRIAVVLMASGSGKRYGKNKLLEYFGGRPLFAHALCRAAESEADSICVVTRYPEIREYVERWKNAGAGSSVDPGAFEESGSFVSSAEPGSIRVIWNDHPERGISQSLRLGLDAQREADGCCFMVCDQPMFKTETLRRMFRAFRESPDDICVCSDGSRRGNPVLFPKDLFSELMQLNGDSGGRQIMKKYPQRIREIIVERPEELYDIDSVENMEFLREHPAGSGHTDENTDRVFR